MRGEGHHPHRILGSSFPDSPSSPTSLLQQHFTALHNSEGGKYRRAKEHVSTIVPDKNFLLHLANPDFNEDDEETKRIVTEIAVEWGKHGCVGIELAIAVLKAAHRLPEHPTERTDAIQALLEAKYEEAWPEIMARSVLAHLASDIMVSGKRKDGTVIPFFKPKIDVEEDDSEFVKRDEVFEYLLRFCDENFVPKEGQDRANVSMEILASAGNAFQDLRTGYGMLFQNTFSHTIHPPTQEDLELLVYGVREEHADSPSVEIFKQLTAEQAARIPEQADFWTPEHGLNLKYFWNVNGGLKFEHPILRHIFKIEITPEQVQQYERVINGTPEGFTTAVAALLQFIAQKDFGKTVSDEERIWQPLSDDVLTLFDAVAARNLHIPGEWAMLPPQDHTAAKEQSDQDQLEALQKVIPLYQAIAEEHKVVWAEAAKS